MSPAEKRVRLRAIIAERSFARGSFKLASGVTSAYYFDLKPTLLHPEGLALSAALILEAVADDEIAQVGGPAYGAIPIVAAVVQASAATPHPLCGFYIRKAQKERGSEKLIDGNVIAGARTLIVEDVTTTAGSALAAIEAARAAGCDVVKVVTIVDREEGAAAAFAARGIGFAALLTRSDFDA